MNDEVWSGSSGYPLSEGAGVWKRRFEELKGGRALRYVAELHKLEEGTLRGLLKIKSRKPSTEIMWALHQSGWYPIAEQIIDLYGLSPADLAPAVPLWQPQPSLTQVTEAVERALGRSIATKPSLGDLVDTVFASCDEGQHFGRWRARMFDVPQGWHFARTGKRGVEFMRWYGPNIGVDPDPHIRTEYLEVGEMGLEQWWMKEVGKTFKAPAVPKQFFPSTRSGPGAPSPEEQWTQCRTERMELVKRMGSVNHAAAMGTWHGAYGTSHAPLLRHANANPTGRHIFLQDVTTPQPTGERKYIHGPFHTILILGPLSMQPSVIGDLVAEALGWLGVGYKQLAHRLGGGRIGLNDQYPKAEHERALRYLATSLPPQPVVVHSNIHFFTDQVNKSLGPAPETMEVLRASGILPVLLHHDPHDNLTSMHWESFQTAASADGEASLWNKEKVSIATQEAFLTAFEDLDVAVTAKLHPTLPWYGPATYPPRRGPVGERRISPWFHHPLIGDIHVRAAYELTSALRGLADSAESQSLRPEFASTSPLHHHARLLKAITKSTEPYLTYHDLEYDEKFLNRPTRMDTPPPGRVLEVRKRGLHTATAR